MKRKTYVSWILIMLSILCQAQTATFVGGGADNRWRTAANWDTGVVPGPTNDVILPSGSNSEIFGFAQTLRVKSITMQGNALLTIIGHWGIDEASVIGPNATLLWNAGTLFGPGVLTNNGTVEHATVAAKTIDPTGIIENEGNYEMPNGSGDFLIEGLFENGPGGIVSSSANAQNINSAGNLGILRNFGTIEANGLLSILVSLENEDGTINVLSGICSINDPNSKLVEGEYNVAAGAEMRWIGGTTELEGVLEGTLQGPLNWFGDVRVTGTATLAFTGDESVYWKDNTLLGGGTLAIQTKLVVESANNGIVGGTTLRNETNLSLAAVLLVLEGTFLNAPSGTVELENGAGFGTSGSAANRSVVNQGIMVKPSNGTNNVTSVLFQNSGTLQIENGTLSVNSPSGFENLADGIVKGTGTLTLTSATPFANSGTFAPGNSPGTLTFNATYESAPQAVLEVELDGLGQGVDYDLLEILGDASFQGTVTPILGFEPAINDAFVVATTTGSITNCNLPALVTANVGSLAYTFSVECRNDNEVVLTVDSIVLATDEQKLDNALILYPNPVSELLYLSVPALFPLETVEILALDGKLMYRHVLDTEPNSVKLDVGSLATGIYAVRVRALGQTISRKFVKQ